MRLADDSGVRRPYRSSMRFRVDPERLDVVVAAVLFGGAQLQVFLSGATGWVLVSEAVVAGLVTASVAVRRRWPAAVGIGAQGLMAAEAQVAQLPAGFVS